MKPTNLGKIIAYGLTALALSVGTANASPLENRVNNNQANNSQSETQKTEQCEEELDSLYGYNLNSCSISCSDGGCSVDCKAGQSASCSCQPRTVVRGEGGSTRIVTVYKGQCTCN